MMTAGFFTDGNSGADWHHHVTNYGVITIRQVNNCTNRYKTTMVTMPQLFYRLEEHCKEQMFMQVAQTY
jgi:hypothetical protein